MANRYKEYKGAEKEFYFFEKNTLDANIKLIKIINSKHQCEIEIINTIL